MASRRAWMIAGAALGMALTGCRESSANTGTVRAASAGEGGAPVSIDSALKLFRLGLEPISALEHSEPSIDRTVARLLSSVARFDTADLRALVMSRREFAYLYYPTSPFTRPPTKQEPSLAWFLHLENSQKGVTRLLHRYGGDQLTVRNECRAPARVEGANRLWDDCVQRIIRGRDTAVVRLFGGIYERNARFKVFSYGNDL